MNIMDSKIIYQFAQNLGLGDYILKELESENSVASQFLSSVVLNFCLKSLSLEKRKILVENLANDADSDTIWQFLTENITDFEKRLGDAINQEIKEIEGKI